MKRVSISIIALLVFSVLTPATAAHADTMGAIYNGTSGDVACSAGGFFTIENNVFLEIPQHSHNCKGDIVIPSGVTTIATLATEWTSNEITSVVIPDSVTEIGANAFPFPQFTSVRIPDGVNSIGNDAFAYGSLTTFDYCGTLLTSESFIHATGGLDGGGHPKYSLVCSTPRATVAAGSTPNSKVATIPVGVTTALIPATAALPATTLNFGGSVPSSVTVAPVASNPAPSSATPFVISGSTKIVDIQISGTFTGSATVCLDGASTDHLFHYTGGSWVELPSRSYVNGQVCGVTTSFSPFAAAAPAALIAMPVPDPLQQSKITSIDVKTAIAGTPTPIVISGSFVEKIRAIQINGVSLAAGSWTQSSDSLSFTMPGKSAGSYQIQIFNGSAPVLAAQSFTFTAPIAPVALTTTPAAKPKVTYIRCAKPGHGTRVAYGINPTCPTGYVKK
jgi:hypothetical protein